MPKRRPDHLPLRTCAVCREVHPKRSMSRLVLRADGSVAVDPTGKAPGGAPTCATRPPAVTRDAWPTVSSARWAGRSQADLILAEVEHATA